MNRMAILAVFVFAAAALGQVGIPPGVILGNPTPGGACSQGPGQIITSTGVIYTCVSSVWTATGTASFPGVSSDGANGLTVVGNVLAANTFAWQRQGVVIAANASDPSPQAQEPSAMWDTSPEVLTSYNSVVKHSWTDGWWPTGSGGTGIGLCFGESADGITSISRISAACPLASTLNHARSFMLPARQSGDIVVYATNLVNGHGDVFTGTTMAGLTLTSSNVISCGSNGTETAGTLANTALVNTSGNNWTLLYECLSHGNWSEWKATSTTGYAGPWTKTGTTPVIGDTGETAGGKCVTAGGAWLYYDGSKMYAATTCGPGGNVPTPYIYWHTSSDGGATWTASANAMITAQTTDEGIGLTNGQVADPFVLPDNPTTWGGGKRVTLYYAAYTSGCPSQTTCAVPAYVKAATINNTLTNLLAKGGGIDGLGTLNVPTISGVSLVSPPWDLSAFGLSGQIALDGNFFYAYDVNNTRWQRTAWDASWTSNLVQLPVYSPGGGTYFLPQSVTLTDATPGSSINYCTDNNLNTCTPSTLYTTPVSIASTNTYLRAQGFKSGATSSAVNSALYTQSTAQALDTFMGTAATLLTAHTDDSGHTWAVYTADGATGVTSPQLTGSGAAYQPSGTATTAYGDVLNSLTPATTDYTVSCTFKYTTSPANVGLFARAASGANTQYFVGGQPGSGVFSVLAIVAGSSTTLGTFTPSWTLGTGHTLSITVAGTSPTAVTVKVDGAIVVGPVNNSGAGLQVAGQGGFRVSGGGGISCTPFMIQ